MWIRLQLGVSIVGLVKDLHVLYLYVYSNHCRFLKRRPANPELIEYKNISRM